MSDPVQEAATQEAVWRATWPYLLALFGGPMGLFGVVKAVAAFRDWLRETRAKVDAVPQQIAIAGSEAMRYARDAQSTGAEAIAATRALRDDVNGLGSKVGRIDTQQIRDGDRTGRLEKDHEKLAGEVRASEKALPELLRLERHAIPDSPTGKLAASLDERVENIKEDHGRRLERLEDKAHDHGGKGQ